MASKWLLVGMTVLSACGGGAMREVEDVGKLKAGLKGTPAIGKCKSNPTGFEIELGYRNKSSNTLGYPDQAPAFNYVGENKFVVGETISLKTIETLDPALEPVFVFPDRCFESAPKSITYQHSEISPDREQVVIDTQTFEADRKNQMQFSLLDYKEGVANNIFPGSLQQYDVTLAFEDGSEVKLMIQATVEPSFPSLSISSIGGAQFSNASGTWGDWGANWAQPRVFDTQRITNPSDRPLMLWFSSTSTFTLRIGNQVKIDENKILNADGYFSIHTVRINGVNREIGYQGIVAQVIQPKETIEVQWVVSPSPSNWQLSPQNLVFKKISEIENFEVGYKPSGYGALFGRDSRSISVSELNYSLGEKDVRQIYSSVTGDGQVFWNTYPNGDVNYHSFHVAQGLIFTGR